MNARKRAAEAFNTGWIAPVTCAVLTGIGSYMASDHQSAERVDAAQNEAADHRYVLRAKVDSLTQIVAVQGVHIRRLETAAKVTRRLVVTNLTPLGPPAPVHRGFFGSIIHFLKAPNHSEG